MFRIFTKIREFYQRVFNLRPAQRYLSAAINRLTGAWATRPLTPLQELRGKTRILRARSRALDNDDDYFRRFVSHVEANVVGAQGIQLQMRVVNVRGRVEAETNRAVERAFARWCRPENLTVTGMHSWRSFLGLVIRTLIVDGEVFVRFVPSANDFLLSLQLISADWVDEQFIGKAENGRRVLMGVELDDYDRPTAYYIAPPNNSNPAELTPMWERVPGGTNHIRIPADQMIHLFVQRRIGQVRGVPFAHTAIRRLQMLEGYEEAELVQARIAACQMAILEQSEDALVDRKGEVVLPQEIAPASIWTLPSGYQLKEFKPNAPHASYSEYVKAVLRGVAAGLGITYHALSGDLESVNYSSARIGSLEERDIWRSLQVLLIERVCQPVFEKWLLAAIGTPALPIDPSRYTTLIEGAHWLPRGWDWVDPEKDAKANMLALAAGLKTRGEICAERGRDFEQVLLDLAEERRLIEELGLSDILDATVTSVSTAATVSIPTATGTGK